MAASKWIFGVFASLLVLGICHAVTADSNDFFYGPPMVLEDEEKPPAGTWNYSDPNTNIYCILSVFAVRLTFEHSDFENGIVVYNLPVNGTSMNGSMCDQGDSLNPTDEVLSISFFDDDFNLQLTFGYYLDLQNGDREWFIEQISLEYLLSSTYFPGYNGQNVTDSVVVGDLDLAYARVHQAFRCDTMTELEPQESDKGVTITMTTWDVDIEAYRDRTDQKMAFPERCRVDQEIDPLVPTIIGVACLVIVAIVLIVYAMMRKNRDRGYQANEALDDDRKADPSA